MTKEKQVTIKMDVRTAAAVRQVLFESQCGYSYEYVPERVAEVRSVIQSIDDNLESILNS
jgi:predicted component of type VI protein secretion system